MAKPTNFGSISSQSWQISWFQRNSFVLILVLFIHGNDHSIMRNHLLTWAEAIVYLVDSYNRIVKHWMNDLLASAGWIYSRLRNSNVNGEVEPPERIRFLHAATTTEPNDIIMVDTRVLLTITQNIHVEVRTDFNEWRRSTTLDKLGLSRVSHSSWIRMCASQQNSLSIWKWQPGDICIRFKLPNIVLKRGISFSKHFSHSCISPLDRNQMRSIFPISKIGCCSDRCWEFRNCSNRKTQI